ncbi:radical SAM protein [Polyangium mundeleinium]|uniref:Radical SAM protein n=1 Tax=Polyangium mundeleinium TaxID=2995306 RepID=A0ABT5F3J9_9BACT|nr:radical SAM protein [Polyangium mundeleinium]MDC0748688.1 radical SAM protein [Polyangium mundeleinium]
MLSVRHLEKFVTASANRVWPVMQRLNTLGPEPLPFKPRWSDRPIPRGKERTKPPLGWPRMTDSLCPTCVKEARAEILRGDADWTKLVTDKPGEIKAHIVERDGQIRMEKECPKHGRVSDVLSIDPKFLERIESLFQGRDVAMTPDRIHQHGSSSIQYGRGAVLTVDLTNRCNMMCDPCFMDANQVGYVHELSWEEVTQILDDAAEVRPRRQMSIQFSGGEPTLSPHFLDAIRYARKKGYFAVQCATNGLRFAQEPGFAQQCKEAGLRMAYLQFDGVTNEANSHRKIANLYDVKLRAIEELAAAGIDVILVVTVVNGVNNDMIGPIIEFAIENADKVTVVSFQPVSFTGRDEDISDELREQQRYTLSHLARDVKAQTGVTEPLRDWFPLSALSPFGDVVDLLDGPDKDFGQLNCGCHPNCGIGTVLFVNKKTKQMVPLLEFLDMEGILRDFRTIFEAGRGSKWTKAQVLTSILRHYKPEKAPPGFDVKTLVKQFMSQTGAAHAGESDAKEYEWRVLFVAGMWFQDLFNYDFRRTEMCIIPYGTQMGEISFCAYNTGVGWRNVLEKIKANATVAEWYRKYGRHPIYAKNKDLALPDFENSLTVKEHELAKQERKKAVRLPIVPS